MVNVRSIVGSKDAPNQSGVRLPYFRNVGNARFFINDKNQDTVEQSEWNDSFSPPPVSDNGFIFGESAIYEEALVKKLIRKLIEGAAVAEDVPHRYISSSYEPEITAILRAIIKKGPRIAQKPIWYFDQLVNDGGTDIYISGDLFYFNRPISSDLVKLASSVGKEKVYEYAVELGLDKKILDQFSHNFNAVCFYLYAESMLDLSMTLDPDDAVIKAVEIQRLGKMIDNPVLKAQLEKIVDHWLKDSMCKEDWKKLLL